MKYLKFIYIISLILLISCDPCHEVDCANPFTDEELLWLPYENRDKLVFRESNSSDSLIYSISYQYTEKRRNQDDSSPYCVTSCIYLSTALGEGVFTNGEEDKFVFEMVKTTKRFNLSSGTGYYRKPRHVFDLAEAIHLDSLLVNNNYLKNVYKYIVAYPTQDNIAETYMHQGMGLVKIKFRNGQDYELVEHITD